MTRQICAPPGAPFQQTTASSIGLDELGKTADGVSNIKLATACKQPIGEFCPHKIRLQRFRITTLARGRLLRRIIKRVLKLLIPKRLRRYIKVWWRERPEEARLKAKTRRAGGNQGTISFYPGRPRPQSVVREIMAALGMNVRRSKKGSVVFFWPTDENTYPPQPGHWINSGCTNIDKDLVDRIFSDLAGYSITVDPRTYNEPYVRKSTRNSAHDGAIFLEPSQPQPGYVYQKLIDNIFDTEIEELRIIYIGRVVDFLYIKRRTIENRFLNPNQSVRSVPTISALSPPEVALVEKTARALGLDCGEIDVLRDKRDGRIYVIDVNRTPDGPPLLFTREQSDEVAMRMAEAFRRAFLTSSP